MKINIANTEKLTSAINNSVEERARVRTLEVDELRSEVEDIEKKLSTLLPKKEWKGLRFEIDVNAQQFPSSYNGSPESTQAIIERGASAWFVTLIWRTYCKGPTQRVIPANLRDKAEEIAEFVSKPANW
jgi:hypothetical protein